MLKINTKKDELGNQFVRHAIMGELTELPEILADPEFDPNVKDELGEPIIHSILQLSLADVGVRKMTNVVEAVAMLMRHPMFDVDESNSLLETPLMIVAKHKGLIDFAKLFIGGIVEPDFLARNIFGDTAEDIALENGNNEVLAMLLNSSKTKKIYLKGIPTEIGSQSCTSS